MRHLLIFALIALSVRVIHAQEVDTETTNFIYPDEDPQQLDYHLFRLNICYEAVLLLNPDLDLANISYGTRITIPANQPCYAYDEAQPYPQWANGSPPRLKYYEDGQWLDEPYYSDEVVYVNRYATQSIEQILNSINICLDVLLADNILLQDFDRYRSSKTIATFDVFIPRDAPPCDPNWGASQDRFTSIILQADVLNPPYFSQQLNICAESIPMLFNNRRFYHPRLPNEAVTISIPNNAPPCYNSSGERLRFYDDLGSPLAEPVYSELEVYIAQTGETLEAIALAKQACMVDLLRVNYFPEMFVTTPIELFIPPSRACPDDVEARLVSRHLNNIDRLALEMNICPQDLAPLNPQIAYQDHSPTIGLYIAKESNLYWAIVPTDVAPCYEIYTNELQFTQFELERILNVCYEEFRGDLSSMLYIPIAAPPCYNADGQRLGYFRGNVDQYMLVHQLQREDSIYSISQLYNVCVHDLFRVNPRLLSGIWVNYPVIIPDTRPCYDEETRLPLIYEDENGNLLPTPEVGDQLIHYGTQPLSHIMYYYNVCLNRIEYANPAKVEHEAVYFGWIIQTNRPPCYGEMGGQIFYVCYNEPIDLTRDYSAPNSPPLSLDHDGEYCYDLQDPQTVVWLQNQRYEMLDYRRQLGSTAFVAWCFGVSVEDIHRANETFEAAGGARSWFRVIPPRTRECYLSNPSLLEGHQTVRVWHQQTLGSIAENFPYTVEDFAAANDIEPPYIIYVGQELIIPTGLSIASLRVMAISAISTAGIFAYLWRRSKPSV